MNGDRWRLITSCFLHIGIIHLLMNMFALADIGMILEKKLGKWNFLLIYIACGIVASAASMYRNDAIVSAWASGAIFGMYGVYAMLIAMKVTDYDQTETKNIVIFIIYNILYGLGKEWIDNAAHIGWLVFGALSALLYHRIPQRSLSALLIGAASIVITGLLYNKTTPSDTFLFQERMNMIWSGYIAQEQQSSEFFNSLQEKEKTITSAQEEKKLVNDMVQEANKLMSYTDMVIRDIDESLSGVVLSDELVERVGNLKKVVQIRKETTQLIVEMISDKNISDKTISLYQSQIKQKNDQIESLLQSMQQ